MIDRPDANASGSTLETPTPAAEKPLAAKCYTPPPPFSCKDVNVANVQKVGKEWSGRLDLNQRHLRPERSILDLFRRLWRSVTVLLVKRPSVPA